MDTPLAVFACLIALIMMMLILMRYYAGRLITVTHRIVSKRGAACRFAFMSDIHIGHLPVKWHNIYDTVKDGNPDFIIISGDFCNDIKETGRVCDFLYGLYSAVKVPVFITFGNHDNAVFGGNQGLRKEFIAAIGELGPGIRVLCDETAVCGGIHILGLEDVHFRGGTKPVIPKDTDIAVSHNADILLETGEECGPSVWLFGHTHGGQIHMPFNFEFTVLKKDRLPKKGIYYGLHDYEGKKIYITSGLGCSLAPVRLGSNPEIVFFEMDGNGND